MAESICTVNLPVFTNNTWGRRSPTLFLSGRVTTIRLYPKAIENPANNVIFYIDTQVTEKGESA